MLAISCNEITAANWRVTLSLSVHPEQQRFIADYTPIAAIVLAKAYVQSGGLRWKPYAISTEQAIVGLLALAYQPDSTDNYWPYHFFIDRHFQGQGYGTAALNTLIELIYQEHPTCQQLNLTVHPENGRAQQIYIGCEFEPTQEQLDGEIVYRRIIPSRNP